MDNITHSLAGAVLGQAGLKRTTGLAMPTLVIGANIADLDAFATLLEGPGHLAIRRGLTHGPIATVVLPLLLAAAMLAFDRLQARRGKRPDDRPPVRPRALLALAFVGALSHPALDWLNNYGIRLLEPFSREWFYGDTLFIVDVWIWAMVGAGLWASRRREKRGRANWPVPARAAVVAILLYIAANGLITGRAEGRFADAVEEWRGRPAELVVANNRPVTFWARQMLWRGQGEFGEGRFSLFAAGDGVTIDPEVRLDRLDRIDWTAVRETAPGSEPFLFWSRMPYVEQGEEEGSWVLRDQRFGFPLAEDRFKVELGTPE